MKRRYKVTGGILITVVLALGALGVALSHNSVCPTAMERPGNAMSMKAAVFRCYGSPDVIEITDIDKPVPGDHDVLVKIRAAAVNPLDWHYLRGTPYLLRLDAGIGTPDDTSMGVDFAGVVEAVGQSVTKFKPGDEVFGGRSGAFADYVLIPEDRGLALKPANMTYAQAASVPIAAITALQALRDKGEVRSGQKVLINGASGGVGTFAVQIAKAMGADVTGVCSTRNTEMVLGIGADRVIDYKHDNYTQLAEKYDVIIDNVSNHSLLANRRALKDNGILVMVGASDGEWIGPFLGPVMGLILEPFVSQKFRMLLAGMPQDDLQYLAQLMLEGKLVPVIDKTYAFDEIPEAILYSESGRARGKILISVP